MAGAERERVQRVVEDELTSSELEHRSRGDGLWSVTLPGTAKLSTECALEIGQHSLHVRAFVCRHPDEQHERVYRWLLERNLKLAPVAFAVDAAGDIHLVARFPLAVVTADLLDHVVGQIAETADASFNTILELGFESSIRREWAWRLDRGESTRNLEAFEHLRPG